MVRDLPEHSNKTSHLISSPDNVNKEVDLAATTGV